MKPGAESPLIDHLRALERRGKALAEFCERVRERGGEALVEEEDLLYLRAAWLIARAVFRAVKEARS